MKLGQLASETLPCQNTELRGVVARYSVLLPRWRRSRHLLEKLYLSGSVLDNVSPINLRGNPGDGFGRWMVSDVAALLKSGRSEHSAVTGSMAQVVHDSTQHMTEPDIGAIAIYLKSLSPAPDAGRATFAANVDHGQIATHRGPVPAHK